ncbi:MAG: FecR domain-containing protein [Pseudomonadota bacterium]
MKLSSISVALLLLGATGTALAEAGRFQFVHGDVSVTHPNGSQTAARKGDLVEEGDTIATGALAQAQLIMKDEGLLALRPDSRLRIDVYRVTGKADGAEQGVLGLLKGGLRSITGWIGRANKENYKVRTATATIGIRGTDHESLYIPPPAPGETALGPAGTYDKVNTGRTYLETSAGRVELGVNQVGFVPASGNTPPVRLQAIPSFLKATPSIQNTAKAPKSETASTSSTGDSTTGAPVSTSTAESPPPATETSSTTTTVLASSAVTAPVTTLVSPSPTGTFNPANPSNGGLPAPNGTVIAGGGMGSNGPSNGAGYIGEPSGSLSVMLDAGGAPIMVNGNNFTYDRNGAPAVMTGGTTIGNETVKWGVYDGGTMVDNGITSAKTMFFWMDATSATTAANLLSALPTSGATLSFSNTAGFTAPITETAGIGGTVTSSVVLKNVGGTPFVDTLTLSVTDSQSRVWNASLTAPQSLDSFRTGSTQNLYGSCSGCNQSIVTGNVQGVVIGNPAPVGMVSSYKMTAGTSAVVGAVLTR